MCKVFLQPELLNLSKNTLPDQGHGRTSHILDHPVEGAGPSSLLFQVIYVSELGSRWSSAGGKSWVGMDDSGVACKPQLKRENVRSSESAEIKPADLHCGNKLKAILSACPPASPFGVQSQGGSA